MNLRKLALAATPGPWSAGFSEPDMGGDRNPLDVWSDDIGEWVLRPQIYIEVGTGNLSVRLTSGGGEIDYPQTDDNLRFIAACSPDRVLAMLDVIEAAEESHALDGPDASEASARLDDALTRWRESEANNG